MSRTSLLTLLTLPPLLLALSLWAGSRPPRDTGPVDIAFERIEHVVTVPPDHNARATVAIEPIFVVPGPVAARARRLIEFHRPRIQERLQILLSRMHLAAIQQEEGKAEFARAARAEVNAVLGEPLVESVKVPPAE